MGQTTINLTVTKSGYVRQSFPTTVYPTNSQTTYICYGGGTGETKRLYFGFSSFSSSLKNRRLYGVRFRVQAGYYKIRAWACNGDFNPSTLTYENAPQPISTTDAYSLVKPVNGTSPHTLSDQWFDPSTYASMASHAAQYFLKNNTFYLQGSFDSEMDSGVKTVLSGGGSPYIEVTYDDSINVASQIIKRTGPENGYVNPRNATSFTWAFERASTESYYCAGDFTQSSAALKWKASGSSSWNTVNASGSTQSLIVPANTFPTASTIEWYLTGTDTVGTTSETEHYSFSTAAGTASAVLISPVGSVEDGSKVIPITWSVTTTDGQTPAYFDLLWKLPTDTEWTYLKNHQVWTTEYNAAAGTFPAGEIQIAIRAYNVDNVAGPWYAPSGNYPKFICVAAPLIPAGLQATEVPRTTISWQASGQEAYEIEIDGVTVAKKYSTIEYSWHLDKPLEDGDHTIRVRIQGVYGLWSSWASVIISIINIPPNTITLAGRFAVDAELQVDISTQPENPYVHWYRDGIRIAETHGALDFTDRTVLGEHSWYAEMWFDTGYYSRSNTVTGMLKSCVTRIAAIDYGSPWFTLNLSENSDSTQNFNWSRMSSLRHVRGSVYPVLELGESEDLTGNYECAFKTVQEARQLESLKGKVVIIKSRGGEVLIGALTKLAKRMKDFYITYSFSVQQIQWEDMVLYDAHN